MHISLSTFSNMLSVASLHRELPWLKVCTFSSQLINTADAFCMSTADRRLLQQLTQPSDQLQTCSFRHRTAYVRVLRHLFLKKKKKYKSDSEHQNAESYKWKNVQKVILFFGLLPTTELLSLFKYGDNQKLILNIFKKKKKLAMIV